MKAWSFDHAAHVKDIEVFSIILKKIDVFLNLESISSSSLDSDESKSRRMTLTVHSKNSSTLAQFSSCSQDSMYDKNHRLNLHQMKKKFHLIAFTTQEDLEVYWQSKNVDSVTILSFKYFEFLDIFFKKNVDILSLHWAYDHVIHLKEDAQLSVFALYNMSRDKILELRCYLNENLSKDFIRVSHFQMIISVLFIKLRKHVWGSEARPQVLQVVLDVSWTICATSVHRPAFDVARECVTVLRLHYLVYRAWLFWLLRWIDGM